MYTIHADCEITRRKRFHLIEDDRGEIVWRTRLYSEAVLWMVDREQMRYRLVSEAGTFIIGMQAVPDREKD